MSFFVFRTTFIFYATKQYDAWSKTRILDVNIDWLSFLVDLVFFVHEKSLLLRTFISVSHESNKVPHHPKQNKMRPMCAKFRKLNRDFREYNRYCTNLAINSMRNGPNWTSRRRCCCSRGRTWSGYRLDKEFNLRHRWFQSTSQIEQQIRILI